MPATPAPAVEAFFDATTGTLTYLVHDPATRRAAVIDPVLDFDGRSGRTSTGSVARVAEAVQRAGLAVDWILETHVHADHLSGAALLKARLGGQVAIGAGVTGVQAMGKRMFNLDAGFAADGSQFDRLFAAGERFAIGTLEARTLPMPGHTPADVAYLIGDAAFIGDTLFMPDLGSARTDFPGGDARTLYRSVQTLLALPESTRLFVCHDYPPAGRGPQWQTTVAEQRLRNIHVRDGVSEDEFVQMREARDRTLAAPVLLMPALQVNIRAGALPPPDPNGVSYLRIPVDAFPGEPH